jgi:hypothetical protein
MRRSHPGGDGMMGALPLPGPCLPGHYAVGPQFCDGASVLKLPGFKEQLAEDPPGNLVDLFAGRPQRDMLP